MKTNKKEHGLVVIGIIRAIALTFLLVVALDHDRTLLIYIAMLSGIVVFIKNTVDNTAVWTLFVEAIILSLFLINEFILIVVIIASIIIIKKINSIKIKQELTLDKYIVLSLIIDSIFIFFVFYKYTQAKNEYELLFFVVFLSIILAFKTTKYIHKI